jgi:hypothetical protein
LIKHNLTTFLFAAGAYAQAPVVSTVTEPVATTTTEEPEEKKEDATFSLSGSVDVYARTSLGTSNPYMGSYAPSTSFADLKGFSLGMVNLIASYQGEKAGFTADVVFGPRGKAAIFGTATGQAIINQMYVYYKLGDKVTLNMGQFNTFLGYEVISPAVNFHYSTSYMFSWGPFNHTGLRADFDLGGGMVAKLAVMNPTDIVEFNPVNTYTLGGQIGHTSDAGGIWFNFLYGDQDGKLAADDSALDDDGNLISSRGSLFQADITTGYNIGEKFYLGFNTTYQTIAAGQEFVAEGDLQDSDGDASSFYGFAVYPKVTVSETFAIGLRAEHFTTTKNHFGGLPIMTLDDEGKGSINAFTLSANIKKGALTIIPEARIDMASENSFLDKDGEVTKTLPSLTLAAVYKF